MLPPMLTLWCGASRQRGRDGTLRCPRGRLWRLARGMHDETAIRTLKPDEAIVDAAAVLLYERF